MLTALKIETTLMIAMCRGNVGIVLCCVEYCERLL
jgi:hypothetical protein